MAGDRVPGHVNPERTAEVYGHLAENGRAVVLVWTADEKAFGEPFDGPDCLNRAYAFADDLRERGDFPDALIAVTGNEAAASDRLARIMARLGVSDIPPVRCACASDECLDAGGPGCHFGTAPIPPASTGGA